MQFEGAAEGDTNYSLTVEIRPAKGEPSKLKYVTTEGALEVSSIAGEETMIDDQKVPATLSFNATIRAITPDKCRATLFLGRTVPYATGFYDAGRPGSPGARATRTQIQQIQVGVTCTVVLESGKPLVIQEDAAQRVTVTLTRLKE